MTYHPNIVANIPVLPTTLWIFHHRARTLWGEGLGLGQVNIATFILLDLSIDNVNCRASSAPPTLGGGLQLSLFWVTVAGVPRPGFLLNTHLP